jgi:Tol biopolymer transport system component
VARTLLVTLGALACALTLVGCGGGDDGSPDIAFVSTRDGDYAIFEMTADGGHERRLTPNDTDAETVRGLFFQVEPAWSPDGTKFAFASRRSGTFDIYVMNADGTGTQRITSTKESDSHPTWSASGERLAFAREGDIYTVGADGSGEARISDPTAEESDPAWSPDGAWIAYVRRQPGTPAREVWLMRPDGSNRHAVTSQGARIFTPAWSPDSMRIVFSSNAETGVYTLYTVGADGKGLRNVVRTVEDNFEPSWSPDGTRIAYQEAGAIFTVELGGGDVEKLTDNATNDSSPAWNPRPPADE